MDYKKLHEIVIKYQSGDKSQSEKLIDAYVKSGFFQIYINIITKGEININHKGAIKFINLFLKENVCNHNNCNNIKSIIREKVNRLNYLFKKSELTEYDLLVEAQIILLEAAKKYNSDVSAFHMYFNKVFCLFFKSKVVKLLYNNFQDYEQIEDHEYLFVENIDYIEEIINKDCNIDFKWILGKTCGNTFSYLSRLDRRILKLYYIDRLKDLEIADMLGYRSRVSFNRKKNRIKTRIDEYGKGNKLFKMR